ncbi:MAG: hypothetical protein ILO43_06865, partial [Clostridia bacterium]|nr:hypothetical protein [Clostridia bacterium]
KIREVSIRNTEFIKTTTQKVKRYANMDDENAKDEAISGEVPEKETLTQQAEKAIGVAVEAVTKTVETAVEAVKETLSSGKEDAEEAAEAAEEETAPEAEAAETTEPVETVETETKEGQE